MTLTPSPSMPRPDMVGDDDTSIQRASLVDHHVGSRIRERRTMLGLSQQQLAKMIGVTYQQAHKYERGLNRISPDACSRSRRCWTCRSPFSSRGCSPAVRQHPVSSRQRMFLELARNFALIDNDKHQEALSQMARALAAQSQAAQRDRDD